MKCADCGHTLEISCPSQCEGQLDALDRGPGWHAPRPPRQAEEAPQRRGRFDTRERILGQLRRASTPLRAVTIAVALNEDTVPGRGRVSAMLNLMEREGTVEGHRVEGQRLGVRYSLSGRA